jgi:hypothetical protein
VSELNASSPAASQGEPPTFRLRPFFRGVLLFVYVFFAVVGVLFARSVLAEHHPAALAFLGLWAAVVVLQAGFTLFRMPWRIELPERSVVFLSRTGRRREIPYAELQAVKPPPFDLNRQSARWVSPNLVVWSVTQFAGWRSLLNEVERRAPHARID